MDSRRTGQPVNASRQRKILHLDLDAFFCAVEELFDPTLRGKAFAVGGKPDERGVVASCSYAAREFGIHSAMPMATAVRQCPQLVIVPHRHGVYGETSRAVMDQLYTFTPLVERMSVDEAFLDVSDLPQPLHRIATELQHKINSELRLPCSLGGATNKLVAKIANDVGKSQAKGGQPPNAITIVPPGEEGVFLSPLPVRALWGVGPKTAERLREMGIQTIGDLAGWTPTEMGQLLGKHGYELVLRARGIDKRSVSTEHIAKSISKERTFRHDIADGAVLRHSIKTLAAGIAKNLRTQRLKATVVKLKLRWPDFTTITRQMTLPQATDHQTILTDSAQTLFDSVWQSGQAVRLLGVGVTGFEDEVSQLTLWDVPDERDEQLQVVLAVLRERYGKDVVRRGVGSEDGELDRQ